MSLYIIIGVLGLAALTTATIAAQPRKSTPQNLYTQIEKLKNLTLEQWNAENIGRIFGTELNYLDYRISGPTEDIGSLASTQKSNNEFISSLNLEVNDRFKRRMLNINIKPEAKITFYQLMYFDLLPQSLADGYITVPVSGNGFIGTIIYQAADKKFISNIKFEYYQDKKSNDLYDLVHQINQLERLQLDGALNKKSIEDLTIYTLESIPQKARSIYDEQYSAGRNYGADGKRLDESVNGKKIIRDIFFGVINKDNSKNIVLTLNANSALSADDVVRIFGKAERMDYNEYANPNGIQIYNRPAKGTTGEMSFHYNDKGNLESVTLDYKPKTSLPHQSAHH